MTIDGQIVSANLNRRTRHMENGGLKKKNNVVKGRQRRTEMEDSERGLQPTEGESMTSSVYNTAGSFIVLFPRYVNLPIRVIPYTRPRSGTGTQDCTPNTSYYN